MNYTLAMARGDSQRALAGYRQRKQQLQKQLVHMVTHWSAIAAISMAAALLTPIHFV